MLYLDFGLISGWICDILAVIGKLHGNLISLFALFGKRLIKVKAVGKLKINS